jgi:hypothetical protein
MGPDWCDIITNSLDLWTARQGLIRTRSAWQIDRRAVTSKVLLPFGFDQSARSEVSHGARSNIGRHNHCSHTSWVQVDTTIQAESGQTIN